MIRRGNLASPGTRVSNTQSDKSQYQTYAIQALLFAIACDVGILFLMIIMLSFGWPILFLISVPGTAAIVLWLSKKFNLEYEASMKLAWGFCISIAASDFLFAQGWWEWIICREMFWLLLIETFSPLMLPSWVYYSLIGLWFFGALKRVGKITLVAIVSILSVWTISNIVYTVDFDLLWSRVRYLATVLSIPWPVAAIIFAFAMTKEMIAPNLNFILETIKWDDYKQAGGFLGLLFPKLVEWKEKLESRVSYNISVMGRKNSHGKPSQIKRRTLFAPSSDAEGLAKFAQAIFSGDATFSERGNDNQKGATDYGYTQGEYKELRTIAYKLGLLDKRGNKYTLNEDGIEALEGVIQRVYPPTP